jgi:hypothetical protein
MDAATRPPTAPGELVFTDEQLTLLGQLAGHSGFPGARQPHLEDAGWAAVAQGLAARGLIHDDDEDAEPRLADVVLGVVLAADRWLWVRIVDERRGAEPSHEILWFKHELRIRQTVAPTGFHRFSTATVEDLLAETLVLPAEGDQAGRTPLTPGEEELERLLTDARRVTSLECGRRADDGVEGELLTIVHARSGELWLLGSDQDASVVLEPIAPDEARERVATLVATLG